MSKQSLFVIPLILLSVIFVGAGCQRQKEGITEPATTPVLPPAGRTETKSLPTTTIPIAPPTTIIEPESSSTSTHQTTTGGAASTTIPTASVKTFTLTAKKWEFEPSTITVNRGDKVVLSIRSVDVTHGFALPDFKINRNLEPGKTVNIEFTADKTGTFTFFCSVFCGEGHPRMNGSLIVK